MMDMQECCNHQLIRFSPKLIPINPNTLKVMTNVICTATRCISGNSLLKTLLSVL